MKIWLLNVTLFEGGLYLCHYFFGANTGGLYPCQYFFGANTGGLYPCQYFFGTIAGCLNYLVYLVQSWTIFHILYSPVESSCTFTTIKYYHPTSDARLDALVIVMNGVDQELFKVRMSSILDIFFKMISNPCNQWYLSVEYSCTFATVKCHHPTSDARLDTLVIVMNGVDQELFKF